MSSDQKGIKYEIIDGVKVAQDMPKKQKEAMRKSSYDEGDHEDLDINEHLDPKNIKARVSMYVDQDVLDEIKRQAKGQGIKYQTFLNASLRQMFLSQGQGFAKGTNAESVHILAQAILALSQNYGPAIQRLEEKIENLEKKKA